MGLGTRVSHETAISKKIDGKNFENRGMDCLFTSELPLPFCNMCGDCGDCGECGDCCDCQCHGMCNGGGINERSLKIFCYTALVVVYLLVVFIGMLYVAKTECAATPAPSLFPLHLLRTRTASGSNGIWTCCVMNQHGYMRCYWHSLWQSSCCWSSSS